MSSASPSTSRVSRAGAPTSRKIGDDRRRIGRGDDGAEQQANHERNLGERPQRKADHRRRDQRGDDREEQDRGGVVDGPPDIRGDPGLEDEQRQKHVDEGDRTDRQIGEQTRRPRRPSPTAPTGCETAGNAPIADTDRGEQNGWRQPQANRKRLANADDDQQARDDEQHKRGIKHGVQDGLHGLTEQ